MEVYMKCTSGLISAHVHASKRVHKLADGRYELWDRNVYLGPVSDTSRGHGPFYGVVTLPGGKRIGVSKCMPSFPSPGDFIRIGSTNYLVIACP